MRIRPISLADSASCPPWAALTLLLLVSNTAWGQVRSAEEHLVRGKSLFEAGQYEDAIREFEAGYALDPRIDFLYAWGQAERLSGDCPSAVVLYERLLATGPDPKVEAAVRKNLAKCEVALAAGPAPKESPASMPIVLSEPKKNRPPRHWYSDALGGALVGSGAVALAVGVGFYFDARSEHAAAAEAASYAEFETHTENATTRRLVAQVSSALGSSLVLAGVIRYVLLDPKSEMVDASLWVDGEALGASLQGTF